MPQSERRPFGRFTGSQAVIVLVSLVIVAIVVALAFRVASGDDSEQQVDSYSAQSATEPGATATDSTPEVSNRLGLVEATAAFGLVVLWVLAGTVVIVRARRAKQPQVTITE